MAYLSKYTGPDIDRRLAQGTYDDAVAAGFTGSKEEFDKLLANPYSPSDQEIVNNKQDKEDPALETENKTVVGAINYLNANKQDKTDERLTTDSKIVVEAINEVKYNTIVLDQKKQPREDLGFSTEQKTVVGAVNELNLKIGELDESKQNAEDDRLDTNDTTVVGAINEVHRELDKLNSEYGQHIDDYEEFKPRVATLETLNIKQVNSDSENYASAYELQDSTGKVYGSRINIAKDQFLKNVSYENNILTLTFILADGTESSQQVDLTDLIDEYVAGDHIEIKDAEDGRKSISVAKDPSLSSAIQIPIRTLRDQVYSQEDILEWFGATDVASLKQSIVRQGQMYLKYSIQLSGNPHFYKMPIEYIAFESANQIKLVFIGLDTRNDVPSKYEIIINLDGTIIEGNSNVKLSLLSLEPDLSQYALKSEIPDTSGFATTEALDTKADKTELENVVKYTDISDANDTPRKTIMLDNNDTLSAYNTAGTANNIAMISKWDVVDLGSTGLPINLNGSKERPTYNDDEELALVSDLTVYQTIDDDSLTTSAKTIPAAINEIKESVDSISDPYEINLTNLLSAEDSESISTAIGGIDNLNATVQDNRIIVGTISNGNVSVSIRILGNITTLYYLLDSVVGLTLNEVKITNTSGTLSKSVTTHSVLTENMVINSLNSDETTLPLSAAQGKVLDNKISSIDVSQDITNAINALDAPGQTASTGEVISSVSQENGIISVSKKTLTSDDIPELPQSKITDLSSDLAVKQNATDNNLDTEDKTIVGAINEVNGKADDAPTLALRKLYIEAGAVYNEETGYYELNGLTDITEEQMLAIYDKTKGFGRYGGLVATRAMGYYKGVRTNIPMQGYGYKVNSNVENDSLYPFAECRFMEVICLNPLFEIRNKAEGHGLAGLNYPYSIQGNVSFASFCAVLKIIYGNIIISSLNENMNFCNACPVLKEVHVDKLSRSIRFCEDSPLINYESVSYLIDNAANTSAITVTVHPTTYSYLTGTAQPSAEVGGTSEEWQALLTTAQGKQISFATPEDTQNEVTE